MTLFTAVTQKLREAELLQSLLAVLIVLVLALVFSWPETGVANHSWMNVAQVRSVLFMLFAVGFGAAAARARAGRLETLLVWWLLAVLSLPIEAFAYAASYPDAPVWWFALQPLLDVGAYFGHRPTVRATHPAVADAFAAAPLFRLGGPDRPQYGARGSSSQTRWQPHNSRGRIYLSPSSSPWRR